MKLFKLRFFLCYILVFFSISGCAFSAEAEPFHSVYYHRMQGSFWAQLADDTGVSPTPRELAIASIQDNFKAIRSLGFDTVTITLTDSDHWESQHGGGFSYDPKNPADAKPQFAVAQEIVLRLAEANQLKVIFAIELSEYRRSSDGGPDTKGLADEYDSTSVQKGAYDYIHCLFDPTAYYGNLSTTKLSTVGLADVPVRSHIGDPRIIGWNFAGEWNVNVKNPISNVCTHEHIFKKYWNFFYDLVHHNGANNAFAGTYLIGQPAGGNAQVKNVKAFKQWFAPGSGIKEPDLIGVEFYGYAGYDLSLIYKDLDLVVGAMENDDSSQFHNDFTIPPDRIFLGEGSTIQTAAPAINQYFQEVVQLLTDRGLRGIQFWVTDTLGDKKNDQGQPTLAAVTLGYDLFETTFSPVGIRKYTGLPLGVSWHGSPARGASFGAPANYPEYQEIFSSAYGKWSYTGPTVKGRWVQQAIANHSGDLNLRFFGSPNPVSSSDAQKSTTLHWDVSKMHEVKTVEIHAGSISGPLVAKGEATGNALVSHSAVGNSDFVLVDTTTGEQKFLGTVTVEVK